MDSNQTEQSDLGSHFLLNGLLNYFGRRQNQITFDVIVTLRFNTLLAGTFMSFILY